MKSFSLFSCFIAASLVSLSAACAESFTDEKPNIIFILADDLGYGDLGCYGRDDINTPRLDAMAKAGVRFTAHYANGPECSPTRAAFLTGRYQQWIGGLECAIGTGNVGRYDDAIRLRQTNDLGLPTDILTLPNALKEAGYATGLFGKWHLGYEPKFAPHLHGFDQTYYCVGGEMDYFHYTDNVAGYNLFRDGNPIRDEGYFTTRMTDEAVKFINAERNSPFFLYLPYTCPHAPFQSASDKAPHPLPLDSPLWKQGKAPPATYRSMIEDMDYQIGRIMDAADSNTLIIFASDNGGTKSARNEPFRGIKGSTFEGGIRVPSIAVWPGKIKAGQTCETPTLTFDWTKTIADVSGSSFPTDNLEGTNVFSLLSEKSDKRTLYWRKPRGNQIWKGIREGDLKYIADQRGSKEREYLFNLSKDPGEQNNLLSSHQAEAKRLRAKFDQWELKTRANRRGRPLQTWRTKAPRPEIAPEFSETPHGELVIRSDRPNLMGNWESDYEVQPGQIIQFRAECVADKLQYPDRELVARLVWQSKEGKTVLRSEGNIRFRPGGRAKAEPEFPRHRIVSHKHVFAGTYRVPVDATFVRVELHLRWAPQDASALFSNISLTPTDVLPSRKVTVAAVHYRPESGTTNAEKREQFAQFIQQAGTQDVDLVVLPESLTYYRSGRSHAECAEPIPGPSTAYFGELAKDNQLYIVAGLLEREGHLVYNTSVLIGPDGQLVGKYRKVSLPRGEIEAGITPGDSLPVFQTSFGRVGMMICYDGFFPEVAQRLAKNGAEIIAWPVWGCNPLLARARACENHVYTISSTYTPANKDWIQTAVYGLDGKPLAAAEEFGTMAIAEIDLEKSLYWESLGDYRAQLPAHRPVIKTRR